MSKQPNEIKILLVEDSGLMRKMEKNIITSLGFENIIEAIDGDIAIAKLQEEEVIDLIISDWNMPNKSGYELLLWIREDEKCKNIPFLMATGQGDREQAQKASGAGVSSFIAKPFNADELKTKIDEALGVKEAEEEVTEEEVAPQTTASGKVKLRVAHIQITDHLLLGVLQHMIKNGQMSPKHFELETRCMSGWNPVEQDLEKGKVDAAFILAPIAMDMFSFGIPIKLVLLAHKNGSIFVRSKQGEYREPFQEFFIGKSFLIPHKMSIHHMLAHMFFKRIGLTPSLMNEEATNINFEVVAPIKMPEFLGSNPDACGYMVAEPLGTKAIASGIAELQFLSGELWENHPCCVVTVRDDFISKYSDAVHEFTNMLVQAGTFIEQKTEMAAEIAVAFLDPGKKLGLKVPLLKNVLKEAQGIKTGDLFPVIDDFDKIQQYMVKEMGIGNLIDLEKFVDTQFAESACRGTAMSKRPSILRDSPEIALEILSKGTKKEEKVAKELINKEGKYLTFVLDKQEYGIDILKIREIIGMVPVGSVPQMPPYVKGVISLRDKVIPIIDLRRKLDLEESEYMDRNCIIILELENDGKITPVGVAVDSTSEILDIKVSDIDETPFLGANINASYILAMAKMNRGVKILLNIDHLINYEEVKDAVGY